MNKSTQVISGNFSGEGKKGNFTAYNVKGDKIFIHKSMMERLGFKADKDVKFPFFAVIGEREINPFDENGQPTNVLTKRLQALSVFKTDKELIDAVNSDAVLEIKAKAALKTEATAAGLTEASLNALMNASV